MGENEGLMKEKLLVGIKWCFILTVACFVFYVMYPKYEFKTTGEMWMIHKCNKISGNIETLTLGDGKWVSIFGKAKKKGK